MTRRTALAPRRRLCKLNGPIGLTLLGALCAASSVYGQTTSDSTPVVLCRDDAQTPEVNALRTALAAEKRAHDLRLKLVEALLTKGCYAQAVQVLEEGERLHPRSAAIQSRLRYVRSMVSEERYFDGLAHAELAAKTERNLLRCRKLRDINACDELLLENPKQSEVLIAKADALLHANRPADALPVYRHAAALNATTTSSPAATRDLGATLNAAATDVDAKIAEAETQRQQLLAQCEQGDGQAALQACSLALLRGADDEFNIHKRTGILLQGIGEPSRALDSYIAASHLNSTDYAVSLAIVALTDSTGRIDAASLAARGNALMALNRASDAVVAFRQAQSLYPTLPGIDASLAAAESPATTKQPIKAVKAPRDYARIDEREGERTAAVVELGRGVAPGEATESVDTSKAERDVTAIEEGQVVRLALGSARAYSNDAPASRSH